jgi:hypothetical protein
MVFVLLWKENIVENFLFVLHHRQAVTTGLLNSFKKQKVCVCDKYASTRVLPQMIHCLVAC